MVWIYVARKTFSARRYSLKKKEKCDPESHFNQKQSDDMIRR